MDDGKRAASVLEVGLSPLRANKGGSLRGGRAVKRWRCWGVGGFMGGLDRFFRSCGAFFSHHKSSCVFVSILLDLGEVSGGFWEAKAVSKSRFSVFFGAFLSRSQFCIFLLDFWLQSSATTI